MIKQTMIISCHIKMLLSVSGAALLLTAVLGAAAGAGEGVEAGGGRCSAVEAHLSVASRRNASGHLLTSLRLAQEARLPAPPSTTLLDVRTITTRCKGVRTDTLAVVLEAPPPHPNPGYKDFQGIGYYKVHVEQFTWDQAKRTCEAEDAHLLILNSGEEAEVIREALEEYTNVGPFILIGAHDKDIEGHYVTIFGDTLAAAGYERWRPGQPDNNTRQNCMEAYTLTMELHDSSCEEKHSFVCEE